MVKWKGSYTERAIKEHEDAARWFLVVLGCLLVARFVLEYLGLWPWA